MKVLVVEDSKEQIEAAKKDLDGHEVIVCRTFNEFEDLLGGTYKSDDKNLANFDVAIIDVEMPIVLIKDYPRSGTVGPCGLSIALRCLGAIKKVGILTSGNHHRESIQRSLDLFAHTSQIRHIGDTKLVVVYGSGGRQKYGNGRWVGETWIKDYKEMLDVLCVERV